MPCMRSQLTISIGDLRKVSIACQHCRTVVTLDMLEPSELATKHECFAPTKCPGCNKEYDSAIRPSLDQLWRAYTALLPIKAAISFPIEMPKD
jgi:hypothetical protein